MDAAAPKLDLERIMSLWSGHSVSPDHLSCPTLGLEADTVRRRSWETLVQPGPPQGKSLLSTGQLAEDSFICLLACSDCSVKGFLGTEPLWPSMTGSLSLAPKLVLCFQDPDSLKSQCMQVLLEVPKGVSVRAHAQLPGSLQLLSHPDPHLRCSTGSAGLPHLLTPTIPASTPGSHFWIS